MASSINNVKYQDYSEHTLSFKWTLSGSYSNWETKSPILGLYDKRQCILEIGRQLQNLRHQVNYYVVISLKALEDSCFKPTEKVTVFIHFKNTCYSNQKYVLNLTKVNSKEFKGQQNIDDTALIEASIETVFEISFKEYASPDLIKDFTLLLHSEKYSDLTIDVRDKTFKVHKNIVSRRNAVLAKMIEVDMIEKHSNKIILNDWQPEIVETFLMFVYTGTCKIPNNYVDLFKLAHILQQSDLEKIIEKHMKHSINLDNFVILFEIADLYELKDLYSTVKIFFDDNKDDCVKNPSFESYLRKSMKLSNIKFVLEVAHAYKMDETLRDAMDFVKDNYEEIVKTSVNRTYIQNNHDLLFKIFEHALGYSPDQQK